ncbi:MAG: hypothetical protein DYG89_31255 [Caldilinea sp. CFX5]|nr:hypothetical protein [Caldilinea sp. CFX5]
MKTIFARTLLLIAVTTMLLTTTPMSVFASDPIFTLAPNMITGRVWVDFNGSGNPDGQESPLANIPVYIQRIDEPDFAMTLVVYTDEVGGYSAEGLPSGTYQVWTEHDTDAVFLLVVTIDDDTPVVTANLAIVRHQVFMPMALR